MTLPVIARTDIKTRSSFHDLPTLPKEVKPPWMMSYRDVAPPNRLRQTCLTEYAMRRTIGDSSTRRIVKTFAERSSIKETQTDIRKLLFWQTSLPDLILVTQHVLFHTTRCLCAISHSFAISRALFVLSKNLTECVPDILLYFTILSLFSFYLRILCFCFISFVLNFRD